MGYRWEDAFRAYLRRAFADDAQDPAARRARAPLEGARSRPDEDPVEIDAVGLTGRHRVVTIAGEAKWARSADADRLARALDASWISSSLPAADEVVLVVCARDGLDRLPSDGSILAVTAADIFG